MKPVVIVGPTASGKSELAMRLAEERGAAILSIDSMQVYRGMDVGTAKPSVAERQRVRHYMIDLVDPTEPYAVAGFQAEARRAIASHAGPLIVAGGSGLHMRAVLDPMEFPPHDPKVRASLAALSPAEQVEALLAVDPEAGEVVDLANPRRVERALEIHALTRRTPSSRAAAPDAERLRRYEPLIPFVAVGVDPGHRLADRIRLRVDLMIESGLLDEVAGLRLGPTAAQAVGYKELLPVVAGERQLEEGVADIVAATNALAKRQRTFFRRDPRIHWLDWSDDPEERYATLLRTLDKVEA